MQPNRGLDALIAEKIMGISKQKIIEWEKEYGQYSYSYSEKFTYYSTEISAALKVVEKLSKDFEIDFELDTFKNKTWGCTFGCWLSQQYGISAPHAICLAALKFVGYQEK